MAIDDASLRIRLEGRAEVLEAALPRYRALVDALHGRGWHEGVRRNREALREVARTRPDVDEALAVARRRIELEAWPARAPLVLCVREVSKLREALEREVTRRSGTGDGTLESRLLALEALVRFAPRLVLPGQRLAVANDVFAQSPELPAVAALGQTLEARFKAPLEPSRRLPFDVPTWDALAAEWARGDEALETLLARLDVVDAAGGTRRAVERRAKRAPTAAPVEALSVVLHARFWQSTARARVEAVLTARLEPLSCAPSDVLPVMRYLLRRELTADARLADEGLQAGRAALLEVAHELTGLPEARPATAGGWRGLLERARLADAEAPRVEVAPLVEALRRLARAAGEGGPRLPPPGQPRPAPVDSLADAVIALRDAQR